MTTQSGTDRSGGRLRPLILIAFASALLLAGALYVRQRLINRESPPPPPIATTQPATQPAVTKAEAEKPPRSYIELIDKAYPNYPTTQPLPRAVDLKYAGHFELSEPIHMDTLGRLWITRDDAEPTNVALSPRIFPQAVLTRERPVFVHWPATGGNTDSPWLVCPTADGNGFELVTAETRSPLGKGTGYDWSRAVSWNNQVVVPTPTGLSLISFSEAGVPSESRSPDLMEASAPDATTGAKAGTTTRPATQPATPGANHAPPLFAFDFRGLIGWIPPTDDHPGSAGVVRFVDGQWSRLTPDQGWPQRILHLLPLLDGSVLQIVGVDSTTVRLGMATLEQVNIDERAIATLVGTLSHPDPLERDKAFKQLAGYGPGALPVIEKLMATALPDARQRLRELLRSRVDPLLGHIQVVGNRLKLASRFPDGGALFYAERGVAVPRGDEPPEIVSPAWVAVRPGQLIRLLDPELVKDFDPSKQTLAPWYDEWVLSDEVQGPRRFLGHEWVPLLRKREIEAGFVHFRGIDRAGRYLFRKAPTHGASSDPRPAATSPTASAPLPPTSPTLLIDPFLPDPKPKLPVWQIMVKLENDGQVGWDKNHWPVMKQGGAWALGEKDWRALKDELDPFYSTEQDVPPPPTFTPPAGATTTAPSNPVATAPASMPVDPPLLVDAEGNAYFGGTETLTVIEPDGSTLTWPLPPHAAGSIQRPWLVRTAQGRLFLYNEPGRLLRLRFDPKSAEPFALEATFTHKIPNVPPTRMWLDPFGRIVFAYEDTLTICFPEGYVPPAIANLLPADAGDVADEE